MVQPAHISDKIKLSVEVGVQRNLSSEMIMSYLPSPVDTWSTYRVQISRETENSYCATYLCNPFSCHSKEFNRA